MPGRTPVNCVSLSSSTQLSNFCIRHLHLRLSNWHSSDSRPILQTQANGAGKSTLIKLLTGEMQPQAGAVWKHPNTRVAYVAQHAFHHLEQVRRL